MAGDARQRMIEGAVRLLAQRGLQATSFTEVLEATGASRGSIYHHFPGGKDELVAEALALAGSRAITALDTVAGSSPVEVTAFFLDMWRRLLTYSKFGAGCSVLAVTVATDSADLLTETAGIFRAWRTRLAELFEQGGLSPKQASQLAAMLVATSEGAVVLARAEKSIEPFETVADQLLELAGQMQG